MRREEVIKKFKEVVKVMEQKTIFTDENGLFCAIPDVNDMI
jgi:hypothetical protein